ATPLDGDRDISAHGLPDKVFKTPAVAPATALRALPRIRKFRLRKCLLAPNEIDQRRHADVVLTFLDEAVVLADVERGEIAESLLEQIAGVEVVAMARAAGGVFELLQAVAFQQQQAARLQRAFDPVEHH